MGEDFYGMPTGSLENRFIRFDYLTHAGPRLVRLFVFGNSDNILAEVPDRKLDTPYGEFHFRGGHRLWHAPEDSVRTYLPDNQGVSVEKFDYGIRLVGPVEQQTGIQKTIEVELERDRPAIKLRHFLTNQGLWSVELAPWALSQFALGGVAVFPQQTKPLDPAGLLPNRQMVIWPYSSWSDPRLYMADDFIIIQAEKRMPPLKIGYMNRQGWLGYFYSDGFLVKRFSVRPDQIYVDFGSNVESFCNDLFIELETLGPLQLIKPGACVQHDEIWEFYKGYSYPTDLNDLRRLIEKLRLYAL